MTAMHWQYPFRPAPGDSTDDYEPPFTLIRRHLRAAADVVLSAPTPAITASTLLASEDVLVEDPAAADTLLDVLTQAGLLGDPDSAGTRQVLIPSRNRRQVRDVTRRIRAMVQLAAEFDTTAMFSDQAAFWDGRLAYHREREQYIPIETADLSDPNIITALPRDTT